MRGHGVAGLAGRVCGAWDMEWGMGWHVHQDGCVQSYKKRQHMYGGGSTNAKQPGVNRRW